jgi:hypothetical protein
MTETPVFRTIAVTCHTEGCDNKDVDLELSVPDEPDPAVVCGVCHQPITDKREASQNDRDT